MWDAFMWKQWGKGSQTNTVLLTKTKIEQQQTTQVLDHRINLCTVADNVINQPTSQPIEDFKQWFLCGGNYPRSCSQLTQIRWDKDWYNVNQNLWIGLDWVTWSSYWDIKPLRQIRFLTGTATHSAIFRRRFSSASLLLTTTIITSSI